MGERDPWARLCKNVHSAVCSAGRTVENLPEAASRATKRAALAGFQGGAATDVPKWSPAPRPDIVEPGSFQPRRVTRGVTKTHMAKLYFYYSSMNAGKSTSLLQSSYNYKERGMNTLILAPDFDDRYGVGKVKSRIGLEARATAFGKADNLFDIVSACCAEDPLHCVLIDEAQFLTKKQVFQLGQVTDELEIPVLAYGIRTDFQGEPFEGSRYLLAWADNLIELKAICHCGRKATMVIRLDENGNAVTEGSQVEIGGNDRYVSMCRKHFRKNFYREMADETQKARIARVVGGSA
jgi:thymidine kinase